MNSKPVTATSIGPMHTRHAKWFLVMLVIWTVLGGVGLIAEEDYSLFKWINSRHSAWGDLLFPYLTHVGTAGFMLIAFIILCLCFPVLRNKQIILTGIAANVAPFLIIQLAKHVFSKPRPLNYFNHADWIHTVAGQPINLHNSFPSGHTAGVFAFVAFLSCLLPARNSGWGIVLFVLAAAGAYSRVYLAQHFYIDVYVGALVGSLISLLMVSLLQRYFLGRFNKKHLQNE